MATRTKAPSRARRTPQDMDQIRAAILAVLRQDQPMTVRQVFYRLVAAGVVAKTEGEYKQTVIRLLTDMRLDGQVPWNWIDDNTRRMRMPAQYGSLAEVMERTARLYRRNIWDDQDAYVEVWLEKDALSGVLYQETSKWGVALNVTRGYGSLTYLHGSAQVIKRAARPAFLYDFGDLDPSGEDITRNVEARLREFAPDSEITFARVAVTREQVEELGLPTRPTKETDSRRKNFEGESVELDAIEPRTLREMVSKCIVRHIDPEAYRRTKEVEQAERETLQGLAWDYSDKEDQG